MTEYESRNPTGMNLLDRAISYISPSWGWNRRQWRRSMSGYDGADLLNRKTGKWYPFSGTGEMISRPARKILRDRARDLERNNDVAGTIPLALQRNVVGKGFNLQANTGDDKLNDQLEDLWKEWQKPINCDITNQQSFRELNNLIIGRSYYDGGILVIKTYTGNSRFPLQLQLREVDDLDSLGMEKNPDNGNLICDGIELNSYNKPVAYYLTETDPNGVEKIQPVRLPAQKVIFLWHKGRPSEYREISMMAPIIERLNDLGDYMKSVSFAQKILSAICVFVKSALPYSSTPLGRSGRDEETGEVTQQERIKPGQILRLGPGEDVSTLTPPGSSADANLYSTNQKRMAAARSGLSLEATARDVSQVNYSSARQNYLSDADTYQDWQLWLIEHFLDEVYTEFVISVVLSGEVEIKDFWQNKTKYLKHEFIPRGMAWIDPYKEAMANKLQLDTHTITLKEIYAKRGQDYKEAIDQLAKEQEMLKNAGINATTDTTQTSSTGA